MVGYVILFRTISHRGRMIFVRCQSFNDFLYMAWWQVHKVFCLMVSIFPVHGNRIFVSSWDGRGSFSCNPKYIIKELEARYPGRFEIIWVVDDVKKRRQEFPSYIYLVKNKSLKSLFYQMTSKIWIDNFRKGFVYKRKSQLYLQTWHGGGAFKRIENGALSSLPYGYAINAKMDSRCIDALISDCQKATDEIFGKDFWYDGLILKTGLPRIDILFDLDNTMLKKNILESIGLPEQYKYVLYAPTFRSNVDEIIDSLDVDALLDSYSRKFGGQWKMLLRLHQHTAVKDQQILAHPDVINVTYHPDMQEIMFIADAGITDYSSWMWEYMHTGRFCIIYAPDFDMYTDERGFYIPVSKWPLPVARDNHMLQTGIKEFDQDEYGQRVLSFFKLLGDYNDGHASQKAVDWLCSCLEM